MRDFHRLTVAEAMSFAKQPVKCGYMPDFIETEFNFSCYDPENDKIQAAHEELTEMELLSYPFESDEVANASLYCYKGKPFMLYEKYGDRTEPEFTIVDREVYKAYGMFLMGLTLEGKAKNAEGINSKILGFPREKQNRYIMVSNGFEGYAVHICQPSNMLGFKRMFDDHHAVYEGQPVKFAGWESEGSYGRGNTNNVKVRFPSGEEKMVDGIDIAFVFKGQMLGATVSEERPMQDKLKDRFGNEIDMKDDTVTIYCDGACRGNPGPGGFGIYIRQKNVEKLIYAGSSEATNNQMELSAAIWALEYAMNMATITPKMIVHTDSKYVIDGITSWLPGWKKKNWKTAGGDPVKNQELWKALDRANSLMKVEWRWVKGHSGNAGNELADQLANQGLDDCLKSKKPFTDPVCETINLAKTQ